MKQNAIQYAGDMIENTTVIAGLNEINIFGAVVYSLGNTVFVNLNELLNDVEINIYYLGGKISTQIV